MKTVQSRGGPKGPSIEFQYDGQRYELPRGLSEWPDDIATHLQRKYRFIGVRIVPSAEEVAEASEKHRERMAARDVKRPNSPERKERLVRAEAARLAANVEFIHDSPDGRVTKFKNGVVVTEPHPAEPEAEVINTPEVKATPEEVQPAIPADGPSEAKTDGIQADPEHP